jgi:hypothetical protein
MSLTKNKTQLLPSPTELRDYIGAGAGFSPGTFAGLTLANDPRDIQYDIVISPGACRDIANVQDISLDTAISKRFDAAWAAGTGQGCLDTGSVQPNSTYHLHAIKNVSTAAVDILGSGSPSNPVMPSGWTSRRRIGAVMTDGDGYVRQFLQYGGWFYHLDAVSDVVGLAIGQAKSVQLTVPQGIKVIADMAMQPLGASATAILSVCDQDLGDAKTNDAVAVFAAASMIFPIKCFTDASRRINVASSLAGTLNVYTRGWFDGRDIN